MTGGRQVFLLKLSPEGEHVFSRCFGSAASFTGTTPSVVVDYTGNVVLLGDADDDIDLGTGVLSYERGDAFVASFAPDGETLWAVTLGGGLAYAHARVNAAKSDVEKRLLERDNERMLSKLDDVKRETVLTVARKLFVTKRRILITWDSALPIGKAEEE